MLTLSDGREFTIAFGAGALMHAETVCEKPSGEIMADVGKGFLKAVGGLLYGSLQKYHRGISLEEAGDIALSDMLVVREALDRAALLAFPDVSGDREGPNPPGKNSGVSGAGSASTRKRSSTPRRARSS